LCHIHDTAPTGADFAGHLRYREGFVQPGDAVRRSCVRQVQQFGKTKACGPGARLAAVENGP
jgi:hypothetical protein